MTNDLFGTAASGWIGTTINTKQYKTRSSATAEKQRVSCAYMRIYMYLYLYRYKYM